MRTIFVGDVHGCAAEFEAFLKKVDYDFTQDRLLLTGDAFARGPDPLAVWQLICDTEAEMVLGNHDARLLKQLTALKKGRKPKVKFPDQRYTLAQLQPAHGEILAWLRQCPLYIAEDAFLLVHAGINPKKGLERHPPQRIPQAPHLAAHRRSFQPALARFLRAGVSSDCLWPRRARRFGGQKARRLSLSSRPRFGLHLRWPAQWLCA